MTLALIVVWMLAAKWRAASPSERRSLAPLYVAGATSLLFVVAYAASQAPVFLTLAFASFAVTPFAFLAGLVRADLVALARDAQPDGPAGHAARAGTTCATRSPRALGDPGLAAGLLGPGPGPLRGGVRRAGGAPRGRRGRPGGDRDRRATAGAWPPSSTPRDLLEDAATVQAAGAATALLLENERLEAELRAHIVELRASRARLVEAGDTERRRLERNLHDGAQSRLVALALNLRLARGGLRGRLARRRARRRVDRRGPREPRRAARARPRDPSRRALRARPRARRALAGRPRAAARRGRRRPGRAACPRRSRPRRTSSSPRPSPTSPSTRTPIRRPCGCSAPTAGCCSR